MARRARASFRASTESGAAMAEATVATAAATAAVGRGVVIAIGGGGAGAGGGSTTGGGRGSGGGGGGGGGGGAVAGAIAGARATTGSAPMGSASMGSAPGGAALFACSAISRRRLARGPMFSSFSNWVRAVSGMLETAAETTSRIWFGSSGSPPPLWIIRLKRRSSCTISDNSSASRDCGGFSL